MLKIGLSLGHIGKPFNPKDRGSNMLQMVEADFVTMYGSSLFRMLNRHENISVFMFSYGEYKDRLKWSNDLNLDILLHLHVDSIEDKTKNRVLCEVSDLASAETAHLADEICHSISKSLLINPLPIRHLQKKDRGYNLLEPCRAKSILIEPFLLSSEWCYNIWQGRPFDINSDMSDRVATAIYDVLIKQI